MSQLRVLSFSRKTKILKFYRIKVLFIFGANGDSHTVVSREGKRRGQDQG